MSTQVIATKSQFFQACEKHDWYFSFSDDSDVYRAGTRREKELAQLAKSAGYEDIWNAFVAHRSAVIGGNKEHPAPKPEQFDLLPKPDDACIFRSLFAQQSPIHTIHTSLGLGNYFRDFSPKGDIEVSAYLWSRRKEVDELRTALMDSYVGGRAGRIYDRHFAVLSDGRVAFQIDPKNQERCFFHSIDHMLAYLLAVFW